MTFTSFLWLTLCQALFFSWACDPGRAKQGKPLFALCWTPTCEPNTQNILKVFSPEIWATEPVSPEGRVNADVVRTWQGRRAPSGAEWRREIFLILRKHGWSCCWAWLIRAVSSLLFLRLPVHTAGALLFSSRGHGLGPLLVVPASTSWGFITNLLSGSSFCLVSSFLFAY